MSDSQERILVVESDPEVCDLIANQVLSPLGYRVKIVTGTPQAIQEAASFSPDTIILNINLPGLSGKDLLVAFSSQGLDVPVIVMAEEGKEQDVIQTFRLGATDYLKWPLREAEIVSAVEHALAQVRAHRDRERLAEQLADINRELKRRVRDLTTIFSIGKAVTSITDPRELFDRIVDGAVTVTEADKGWLYLRKGNSEDFTLNAQKNLSKAIVSELSQVWTGSISSLVALSGETFSIHGEPLKRFKAARWGQSILIVPVKAQKEVVGILAVMREKPHPFDPGNEAMLEALSDYASVSLVNARLFQAVEKRARRLQNKAIASQEIEHIKVEILRSVHQRLEASLAAINQRMRTLLGRDAGNFGEKPRQALIEIRAQLLQMKQVVDALSQLDQASSSYQLAPTNINDLARQALNRSQDAAEKRSISLVEEVPGDPVIVSVDVERISQVFDVLLSNAILFSKEGGQVTVVVEHTDDGGCRVSVHDTGPGLDEQQLERVFHPFYQGDRSDQNHHGIGLTLAKEIIKAHHGKIWAESQEDEGAVFIFVLPALKTSE
jgi:signal transduction histidine kinase/FixJ family two-component response regulator